MTAGERIAAWIANDADAGEADYAARIDAAIVAAESSALERAAQAFAEAPTAQHSGAAVASVLRYLARDSAPQPAAAPAAPCAVEHCPWPAGHGAIHGYAPPSEPVAPSLLPRVLAALEAVGRGVVLERGGAIALVAELRRYIATDPRDKRIAELEDLLRDIETTLAGRREREGASPATVSEIVLKIVRKLPARTAARSEGET